MASDSFVGKIVLPYCGTGQYAYSTVVLASEWAAAAARQLGCCYATAGLLTWLMLWQRLGDHGRAIVHLCWATVQREMAGLWTLEVRARRAFM